MPRVDAFVQTEMPSPLYGKEEDNAAGSESIRYKARQKDTTHTSSRPQHALLSDMELPLRRTFFPLGFAVEIITNDPDVLEAAHESFGHRRLCRGSAILQVRIGISEGGSSKCPPEPTQREYNHLYSLVADGDNQALLDLRACTSFVWLKKAALNNRLYFRYNFLEKVVYLLLGASAVTDIRAGCISKNGKGILLCGDSGAGKSTLAYACARAGWTYTSDDTCYLINDSKTPRVIGHSHRVRFRPEAKAHFPELENRNITPRMEGKPSIEVQISEIQELSIRTAPEVKVHSIVYLNRYPLSRGKLARLPDGTATLRACQELFSAGEIREKHESILQILSDVPTYELHYRNLHDALWKLELLT
jgi:energy-coupling factor transporter ATP-binding protein EcfA2